MKISVKTKYACQAMVELAAAYPSQEPVHLETIASRHRIPRKYLSQIMMQLRQAGLIVSRRGSQGGHRLAKPPAEISLGSVLRAVEGPLVFDGQAARGRRAPAPGRGVAEVLEQFKQSVDQAADAVTLETIAKSSKRTEYYI